MASEARARGGTKASSARSSRTGRTPRLFISCEHGGNLVPADFAALFAGRTRVLHSHRGWDPGALELAGAISARAQAPLCFALTTRLLIDLNRSLDNPTLFSNFMRTLSEPERQQIIAKHYRPYREYVEHSLAALLAPPKSQVIHVSVHTFTPVLRGHRRTIDIGLLFDPARPLESAFARAWRQQLKRALPRLSVQFNQPYRGTDDGLTTYLRTVFPPKRYAGLELEVNQRFPRRGGRGGGWSRLVQTIADTLADTSAGFDPAHR